MLILAQKLAEQKTEADRKEFLQGVCGLDKYNVKSLAAGWLATSLLLKRKK
jgi:hypothetical protein